MDKDIDDMCDWISKRVDNAFVKIGKLQKDFIEGRIDIYGNEIL